MKKIRARFKAVVIAVLLLAIMLCSAVLYTMETGRTQLAQARTTTPVAMREPVVATPVSAVVQVPVETPLVTVNVAIDGNKFSVNSPECTVADFLEHSGIELGEHDIVLPRLNKKVSEGEVIRIITISYRTITEKVETSYETEYIEDDEMYEGDTEVEQYGITGVTINTYEVKYRRGKVAYKNLIDSVVKSEPQTQIIRTGTKVREEEVIEEPEVEPEVETPTPAETTQEEPSEAPAEASEQPEAEETPAEETPEETPAEPVSTDRSFANDYQRYAYERCIEYGWSEADFDALVKLWNRESGWNPTAKNSHSGAYGIPQALPGNKMESFGSDWETNGYVQVDWGLNYIAGRYGNPSVAWQYFSTRGWY
ncbi:MAG: G5 domain-containing protein [Firmicutes bacterium]|nr:G5 domain-containing protein [Bacillota bacterium]